jgi:hypothetical protein
MPPVSWRLDPRARTILDADVTRCVQYDSLRLLASWAATLERENTGSRSANAGASDNA